VGEPVRGSRPPGLLPLCPMPFAPCSLLYAPFCRVTPLNPLHLGFRLKSKVAQDALLPPLLYQQQKSTPFQV
jgi:hypothetical protein